MTAVKVDVAIIGAGPVGAGLAAALCASPLKVALLDRSPPRVPGIEWDARIYTVSPSSIAFLERLGAWQEIDSSRVTPVRSMRIFGDDGVAELDFSAYEAGVAELAATVEAGRLAHALWARLEREPRLALLAPSTPARIERTAQDVRIGLESGETVQAK